MAEVLPSCIVHQIQPIGSSWPLPAAVVVHTRMIYLGHVFIVKKGREAVPQSMAEMQKGLARALAV